MDDSTCACPELLTYDEVTTIVRQLLSDGSRLSTEQIEAAVDEVREMALHAVMWKAWVDGGIAFGVDDAGQLILRNAPVPVIV